MRKHLLRRPSPGTVMGGPALFISLGGLGYAATAQGAFGILTVEAATVNRSSDCHRQAQGLLTN